LQTARPLAPELGETHFAQAQFYYWGNRDYRHALEALEMAARSLPNSADVFRLSDFIERRLGRWAEAMRHFSRAAELDPRDWGNRINVVQTYHLLRHYSDAEQTADRAMGAFPEAAEIFRRLKGEAALAKGDTKRASAVLGAASAANLWLRFRISMCERNYAEAERLSVELSQNKALDAMYPSALWTALASRAEGNSEKAHSAFLIARRAFEAQLRDRPDDPEVLAQLSVVDAGLGGKEDALRESRRAVELRPISHDAVEGAELLATLAVVYTWIGERDQAIEQLSSLVKLPNSPSLGELKLNPWWDDLRADPRFAQIVADAVAPIPIQ